MWFIGVEVEQETTAPPPKKNQGSAPDVSFFSKVVRRGFLGSIPPKFEHKLRYSCIK